MMYFEHRLRQSHRFVTNKQPNVHGSTWSTRYLNCQTILSNSLAYSSMCWIILYAGISCFASLSVSVSKQQKLSCFKSHPRWGKKKWSQEENSQLHSRRKGKRTKHNYFLPFQQRTSYLFRCQSTESQLPLGRIYNNMLFLHKLQFHP